MDLIEKIEHILTTKSELKFPKFDIYYDDENQIVGYIADESFDSKTDEEAQHLIWNTLKKRLGQDDLRKISVIFHETLKERAERLMSRSENTIHSKYWLHKTPKETKYWLFIGVDKFEDEDTYKAFFLIINEKDNFIKRVTFVYDKEILAFMELGENVEDELYSTALSNAESEIKLDLMKKYDELKDQQNLIGKNNLYNYVFENFKLTPIKRNDLKFTDEESCLLDKYLKDLDNFSIKKELQRSIEFSKKINKLKSVSMDAEII